MTYPNATNLNSTSLLVSYANDVTGGWLGIVLMLSLWAIVFISLKTRGEETSDCFLVAGWVTVIPSIMLFLMGIMNGKQLFVTVGLLIIGFGWSYWGKSE